MAFFSKTNVMIKFCKKWQQFEQKTPIFSQKIGENIFKIITFVPVHASHQKVRKKFSSYFLGHSRINYPEATFQIDFVFSVSHLPLRSCVKTIYAHFVRRPFTKAVITFALAPFILIRVRS
jgi:hypothetical protein